MSPTKEAARADSRPYELLIRDLSAIAQLDADSGNFDIAAVAIDGIMTAEDVDSVFDANDAGPMSVKGSAFIGVPLSVFDIAYRKSAERFRGNGLGIYCVFDAFLDDGSEIKLTTGAPNLVASFRKLETLGALSKDNPTRLVIKARETENGELLTIVRPPVGK
jgi:hypothetical protein